MGFFSWRNQDTGKAIYDHFVAEDDDEGKATMTDDKGNKWVENCYEGFGIFGGKDYYELLAEMNIEKAKKLVPNLDVNNLDAMRGVGITLGLSNDKSIKKPNLNFDETIPYKEGTEPKIANGQGHWEEEYDLDDEEED